MPEGANTAPSLDQPWLALRHIAAYLAATLCVCAVGVNLLFASGGFRMPVPGLFSSAMFSAVFAMFFYVAAIAWPPVALTNWALLKKGWRSVWAFVFGGAVIALFALAAGLYVLEISVLDLVSVIRLYAFVTVVCVPANLIYWGLAVHPLTLPFWQKLFGRAGKKAGRPRDDL